MSSGDKPLGLGRGGIGQGSQMQGDGHRSQKIFEREVGRSVINGIAPQNDERFDCPRLQSGGEGLDGGGGRGKRRLHKQGAADGPQSGIHGQSQDLNRGWLASAHQQD